MYHDFSGTLVLVTVHRRFISRINVVHVRFFFDLVFRPFPWVGQLVINVFQRLVRTSFFGFMLNARFIGVVA